MRASRKTVRLELRYAPGICLLRSCQIARRLTLPYFFIAVILVAVVPRPAFAADPAMVTFTLDFPASDPEHYSITVNSDGHAKYECSARISQDSTDRETYRTEFDISPANRTRIFDLAAQANFFNGKVDSGKRRIAFTGKKKLAYQDAQRSYSAEYNYSQVAPVQELTSYFQNVAATLEFGRRLTYYHHYQKLALDDELKQMETQLQANGLSELQAVQPILQEIHDDPSVLNVVRVRAQKLIDAAKSGVGASR